MAKGPEAKLWQDVKKALKDAHLVRIENKSSPGVPDVNGCYKGIEFWLELKVIKGNSLQLSKFQKAWIYERTRAGGKVFVLARPLSGSVLKVFEGSTAIRGHRSRVPVLRIHDRDDWKLFLKLLGTDQAESCRSRIPVSANESLLAFF